MAKQIITKRCVHCKEIKPISEFHKNRSTKDGFHLQCKDCEKEYRRSEKGKVSRRIAQKRYSQSEKGKAVLERHKKTTKYKTTERNRRLKHIAQFPERLKARNAVHYAIKVGQLPRPNTKLCYCCPKPAQEYHHWHGYAPENWLDVMPVCIKCHRKIHNITSHSNTQIRERVLIAHSR